MDYIKPLLQISFIFYIIFGFSAQAQLSLKEQLGKDVFFDKRLSTPPMQACASCHAPRAGFADPDTNSPTSEGAVRGLFGNRNTPTAAYAAFSPDFTFDNNLNRYVGGQFWDGRAKDLAEQAKGPFLNPVEMNNASKDEVIGKVRRAMYAALFEQVYGAGALDNVETAYDQLADAISAYERTDKVNQFSSKFDAFLRCELTLTAQEQTGLALFESKGRCNECHTSEISVDGVFLYLPILLTKI